MTQIGLKSTALAVGLVASLPALALEPLPGQLGYADVADISTPGALWCFDPQKNTCSFITVMTDPVKSNPRYDVLEMWDADTVLTSHTGGILRRDGTICERGTAFIESAEVTDRNGTPVGTVRLENIRAEMRSNWNGYEQVNYCYAYVPDASGRDGLFVQEAFADGEITGGALTFLIDYDADARNRYTTRPPE